MKKPIVGLALLIACTTTTSLLAGDEIDSVIGSFPGRYKILTEDGVVRIPFEVVKGDIFFLGEMNGKGIRMLLDNGFLWDQLLFFGSPRVDSLGMTYDGEISVGGGGSGDAVQSKTASDITLSFPGIEFYDQTAVITPYTVDRPSMWSHAEGQVSATFLKHFIVDINFDKMVITLTEPSKFTYEGSGTEIKYDPLPVGVWAFPGTLELTDGRIIELDMSLDLGDGNPLFIETGGANNFTLPEQSLEASLGFGMQGEILGHYGRVKSVTIGGHMVKSIVTAFVSPDYGGPLFAEVTVGLPLMSRFNFVFDYPGRRMIIEPNHTFIEPFEHSMTGMALRPGMGKYLEVVRVWENTPASEAGLTIGDRVVRINGQPAADLDRWSLEPTLTQEGRIVTFTVSRDDQEVDIEVTLRRII